MSLDNLIIQVSYRGNSRNYSGILNHLIGLSPDFGIGLDAFNQQPRSPTSYVFNSHGEHLSRSAIEKNISRISEDVGYEIIQTKDAVLDYFGNLYDCTGEKISKSKYKIMLPCSLDYNTFFDAGIPKFNAVYTDVEYIGLLEHILHRQLLLFNYRLTSDVIDEDINSQITDGFINLNKSVDFCRDILQHIADMHQEKVDIDVALKYFLNNSLDLVILAVEMGINYIIENGYAEYKNQVLKRYRNVVSHRSDVISWKMRTLVNGNIGMSYAMYGKLVDNLGISRNKPMFIKWHQSVFETSEDRKNTVPALLNTISKLMFGKRFNPAIWTMESQIVFDCAVAEKLGISDGVKAYKEYLDKHY
jgi:hypothetical protein